MCSADPTSRNVSGSATEHANDDSAATDQSSGVLPIFKTLIFFHEILTPVYVVFIPLL